MRLAEVAEPYMTRPVEPELLERFGRDAATVGRAALEGTLHAAMGTSFADRLAAITTPTLVIGGSGDPMFTPERCAPASWRRSRTRASRWSTAATRSRSRRRASSRR